MPVITQVFTLVLNNTATVNKTSMIVKVSDRVIFLSRMVYTNTAAIYTQLGYVGHLIAYFFPQGIKKYASFFVAHNTDVG